MKKQIIILIICGLVILAVGFGAGFLSKSGTEKSNPVIKTLSSKLVSSIMAFGQVKEISSDNNLTLEYKGNSITVKIRENAKIMAIVSGAQKQVNLSDVKTGDFVNVSLVITPDNTVEGSQILILPTTGK